MPGKRIQIDDETWQALDVLAKDRMSSFQELADEAFRDLLRKHGVPSSLKEALSRSANKKSENVVPLKKKKANAGRRKT